MAEQTSAHWRYAMTREVHGSEAFYTIREVYTSRSGKIGWTKNAIAARGDTWQEVETDLALMTRAVRSKILDISGETYEWISPSEATRRDHELSGLESLEGGPDGR